MIRQCREEDFETIFSIINDAAQAYGGVIPANRWKEPYMSEDEIRHEMDAGVVFWGYEEEGELVGVVGRWKIVISSSGDDKPPHSNRHVGRCLLGCSLL